MKPAPMNTPTDLAPMAFAEWPPVPLGLPRDVPQAYRLGRHETVVVDTHAPPAAADPRKQQVGGEHYLKLAITPRQYALANKLNADQFSVVKYTTRYEDKNGVEDLKKARHILDMMIADLEEART